VEPAAGAEDGLLLAAADGLLLTVVWMKDNETVSRAGEVVVVPGDVVAGVDVIVIDRMDVRASAGVGVVPLPPEADTGDKTPDEGSSICNPSREGT
jgi:hypothetical protein